MKKTVFIGLLLACFFAVLLLNTQCNDTPYKEGRFLYESHCESCHGDNGVGLLALIPPIAGSDYLKNNRDTLPCIILNGLHGTITVNDRQYEGAMPGVPYLKPVEVGNLINYIQTSFGNEEPPMHLPEVERLIEKCGK